MASFAYTGRSNAQAVSGVLDGTSADDVAETLLSRGVVPLTIKAAGAASASEGGTLAQRFEQWSLPKVSVVDLMLLSRQLHTLLKSGVPILDRKSVV